MDKLSSNESLL